MNYNNNKCKQCKKEFPEQELYRIGIKQKDFFCHECAKNIKSECMWCGKELAAKKWKRLFGYGIKSEEGKLAETINHDDHRKEKHHKYYLLCEESREHGMRPNKSCPSRFNDWWVKKSKQKYQDRKDQGWKNCAGKGVYHKDSKTGKVIFDLDCYKLVPPGQEYCGDDQCIYYTAVYKGIDSTEKKSIRERWNNNDQEKYRRANEWWNSLSLDQKQAELKKEEQHLNNLGLQRQCCWIERLDKNSILFENGKIYYDNMDKIPPSFLHDWGYPGYQWESVWKNDSNSANTIQVQSEIKKEVDKKEVELEQAKKKGDNEMSAQLEQQIQELKSQQQDNSSTTENHSSNKNNNNSKIIAYSVGGICVVVIVGFIFWVANPKSKKRKIK
ncbi:MAG: hypothetical protein I3273_06010 [Candidatus Moeniiplasma glomeromycotorum]|nr:hypothetical protein [Candidatus Moeniiplasma glomeromycotorum]MCE8168095.1 hypothetical protein [Candidatus Moeniiplasma glomeromycotorum]MCE8169639.1 hypothetical protein [Candidatus Moeniiplasma glomeromycotorum]